MILKYTITISIVALILGFLSQRSRMCFVGGLRDWMLIGEKSLFSGLISFVLTVWILTSIFYSLGLIDTSVPEIGEPVETGISSFIGQAQTAEEEKGPLISFIGSAAEDTGISVRFIIFTFIGGIIMGAAGVAANGCVLRQHVLLGQGNMDSLFFIAGMIILNIIYYLFLYKIFAVVY